MLRNAILETKNICKSFYEIEVLHNVNFQCNSAEIHALVGENGAGKSTLMKIISGVYPPSKGELFLNGERFECPNTLQAQEKGISIIHQEFNLIPYLSVAENIFLGRQPLTKSGNINYAEMNKRVFQLSSEMDVTIDPEELVSNLTVAQQQMVEIMKAISINAQIVIMDEPTAALTPVEVGALFRIMRKLKEEGKTIIYISHRLNEIFEITDRITVMKDGEISGSLNTKDTTKDEVVSMMVGRQMGNIFPPRREYIKKETVLEVKNLTIKDGQHGFDFSIHAGEIAGVAGLEGQGQREMIRALFGLQETVKGDIFVDGKKIALRSPKDAIRAGISFLTDDRKSEGMCLDLPIFSNICLPIIKKLMKNCFVFDKYQRQESQQYMSAMNIKAESSDKLVKNLSGGNQQKVLLGKCLSSAPKILLIHEPTRGIDVAAKMEIYVLLQKLARENDVAIMMVSSDLMEIVHVSDRVLVVYDGMINGEIEGSLATEEKIMALATNIKQEGVSTNGHQTESLC